MMITSHKDLIVWQKSIVLAARVYAATRLLPRDERFGLTQQMRRSVISVASNIAEGSARRTRNEYLQYLHIARGSLAEVETQILIAIELAFLTPSDSALEYVAEVGRMLNALIRSLVASGRAEHAKACAPNQPLTASR